MTKREIVFFIAGILTVFIIETICDWEGVKDSIKRGWNTGYYESKK